MSSIGGKGQNALTERHESCHVEEARRSVALLVPSEELVAEPDREEDRERDVGAIQVECKRLGGDGDIKDRETDAKKLLTEKPPTNALKPLRMICQVER